MKKLVAGIVGLLGAAALTGCSPSSGTAAIVNGVAIPDSRVSSWAEGCAAALEEAGRPQAPAASDLRLQAVQWVVIDQLSRDYLETTGWTISNEELHRVVESSDGGADFLGNETCTQAAYAFARHNTIASRLGTNIGEYLDDLDVQINPRYGVWDLDRFQVVATGSMSVQSS